MKRVYANILALILALSMAVPAWAGEATGPGAIEVPQTPENSDLFETAPAAGSLPVISVAVPTTGQFRINPYGLPVETDNGVSRKQIVGTVMEIFNAGDPVTVKVSAVASIPSSSGIVLAEEPPQADARDKEIFLYAEFIYSSGSWSGRYSDAENQLLITKWAEEAKQVLTLGKREAGLFQLFGATAVDTETDWGVEDTVKVTILFTFTAVEESRTDGTEGINATGGELTPSEIPGDETSPGDAPESSENEIPSGGTQKPSGGEISPGDAPESSGNEIPSGGTQKPSGGEASPDEAPPESSENEIPSGGAQKPSGGGASPDETPESSGGEALPDGTQESSGDKTPPDGTPELSEGGTASGGVSEPLEESILPDSIDSTVGGG